MNTFIIIWKTVKI